MNSIIQFVHLGVSQEQELNPKQPIVYRSESTFVRDSESNAKVLDSLQIPASYKNQLRGLGGKWTAGRRKMQVSFNLYTDDAAYIDGTNRLCYVQFMAKDEHLLIAEYGGTRGAHFSGMFQLLGEELRRQGVVEKPDGFVIGLDQLEIFNSVVNQLIADKQQDRFTLVASQDCDKMRIGDTIYYYYKAYWQEKPRPSISEETVSQQEAMADSLQSMQELIRTMARNSLGYTDIAQLKRVEEDMALLQTKLQTCMEIIQTQITGLEKIDTL